MEQNRSSEINSYTAGKEIPIFYSIRMLTIVFTRARHWTLSGRTN